MNKNNRFFDYANAAEFFEACRHAVNENKEIADRLEYLKNKSALPQEKVSKTRTDINGTAQIMEAVCYERVMQTVIERNDQLIKNATAVVEEIAKSLGSKYADVVIARVLVGLKWSSVAAMQFISRITAIRNYQVACDWCDSVGVHGLFSREEL
ncbi:MAG: hypothetical protein K2O14_02975 [Oscillospiraceae bacterium]|nr:hypothetical protein [Oscillospiraceae bacterium]